MSQKKLTGGSVDYYRVKVTHPTTEGVAPYTAECNDIIEALNLNFREGNILKAIWRNALEHMNAGAGKPGNPATYDAEKVVFFAKRSLVLARAKLTESDPEKGRLAERVRQANSLTVEANISPETLETLKEQLREDPNRPLHPGAFLPGRWEADLSDEEMQLVREHRAAKAGAQMAEIKANLDAGSPEPENCSSFVEGNANVVLTPHWVDVVRSHMSAKYPFAIMSDRGFWEEFTQLRWDAGHKRFVGHGRSRRILGLSAYSPVGVTPETSLVRLWGTATSSGHCPNCGEVMEGDGHTRTRHCPNTDQDTYLEPDANPVYCNAATAYVDLDKEI